MTTGKKDRKKNRKNNRLRPWIIAALAIAWTMMFAVGVYAEPADTDVAAIGDTGYPTVQSAVDAAGSGDTVRLLHDTAENVTIQDKEITVDLNQFSVEGVSGDYSAIRIVGGEVTVRNGALTGGRGTRKVEYNPAWRARQPASGTYRGSLVAENAVVSLEGVTLTKSKGNALVTKDCAVTVSDCEISGNDGSGYTIVCIEGGETYMKDTAVTGNTGACDTVAVINQAKAVFEGCEITGNAAQMTGGLLVGAAINDSYVADVTLKDTRITGNRASSTGTCVGGLCVWYGKIVTENATIAENRYSGSESTHLAHDILIKRWLEGSGIQKADTMPGGYEGYCWVDRSDREYIDGLHYDNLTIETQTLFSLGFTAEKAEIDAAAEYNGQAFSRLSKAVDAAVSDNAADGQDKSVKLLRDLKDTVSIPDSVSFRGTLDIDLGGHTLEARSAMRPVFHIRCGGEGTVFIHDGKIEGGRNESQSSTKATYAGGLIFDTGYYADRKANLRLEGVGFDNNVMNQTFIQTLGTVDIIGCSFTCSDKDLDPRYALYFEMVGDTVIRDCDFHDAASAIYAKSMNRSQVRFLIENTKFRDNIVTRDGGSYADSVVYLMGFSGMDVTMRKVEFSGNRTHGKSAPGHILCLEGENADDIVRLENCRIADNQAGYREGGDYSVSSTISAEKVNLYVKDSRIEGNKAIRCGGILQKRNGSEITLEDSVVTGNTASGSTAANQTGAGGISVLGVLTCKGRPAIYNNTVEKNPPQEFRANDILVARNASIVAEGQDHFIAAKDMKDGDADFSGLIWKDGSVSAAEEHPEKCVTDAARYYTAIENVDRFVARVGETSYRTVQEAVDAAEPGETVILIAEELRVDTDPLSITKDLTFDFNGRNLRLSRAAQGDTAVTIGGGARVIWQNSRSEQYAEGGVSRGRVALADQGALTVSDPMGIKAVDHSGAALTLDAVTEGAMEIGLGAGRYVSLGDSWKSEAVYTKKTLNLSLSAADLADIEAGNDRKIIENGDESLFRLLRADGVSSSVVKKMEGSDILLHKTRAVYLSGSGSNANSGLEPGKPVATFDKALGLLRANPLAECIYITGTVAAKGTWAMPEGESRPVLRYSEFSGYLIQTDGDLLLKNIIIDGQKDQKETGSFSLIKVGRGTLTLDEGAELRNNNGVDPDRNHKGQHTVHGGAIISESASGKIVMLPGSSIHDNEAFFGGGIFIGCTAFEMKGGVIENNRAIYYAAIERQFSTGGAQANPAGGGVMVAFGASMTMEKDAVIRGNVSDDWGGGICLGNRMNYYSQPGMYETSGKSVKFSMNGGRIEDNRAANGGGLFVQGWTKADIVEGSFIGNSAGKYVEGEEGSTHPRGGAIYVNKGYYSATTGQCDPGWLIFHSPTEIAGNRAAGSGGGIMTASSAITYMRDLNGFAIHDNTSYHAGQVALTGIGDNSVMPFRSEDVYITELMPGGGEYEWTAGRTGAPVDMAEVNSGDRTVSLETAKDAESPEMQRAIGLSKVHILNNSTFASGGAIASDGRMEIGSYLTRTDVTVTKEWDDEGMENERPKKVTVQLLRDGSSCREAEIAADSAGEWKHTFAELPRYQIDPETGEETSREWRYTVKEDESSFSGSENVSYASRVAEEADGSRPAVRYSEDPLQPTDDVRVLNRTIVNKATKKEPPVEEFVITYDLNGGNYDGKEDNVIEKYPGGTEITIPPAPVRAGYTFLYWKGSEYQPGAKYTVNGNHTFTAQWQENGGTTGPVDPTGTTEPADPTGTSDPTDPVGTTEPIGTTEPGESPTAEVRTEPDDPTNPGEPGEPTDSEEPPTTQRPEADPTEDTADHSTTRTMPYTSTRPETTPTHRSEPSARTGDGFPLGLVIALLLISLAGITVIGSRRGAKKKREYE